MNGEANFLDYREKAPLAADRDMYLDAKDDVIEDASLIGHLSVGVPATVAGFWQAHQRYGTLPWKDLVMPAVKLAEDGFVVPDHLANLLPSSIDKYAGKTNFAKYFNNVSGQWRARSCSDIP